MRVKATFPMTEPVHVILGREDMKALEAGQYLKYGIVHVEMERSYSVRDGGQRVGKSADALGHKSFGYRPTVDSGLTHKDASEWCEIGYKIRRACWPKNEFLVHLGQSKYKTYEGGSVGFDWRPSWIDEHANDWEIFYSSEESKKVDIRLDVDAAEDLVAWLRTFAKGGAIDRNYSTQLADAISAAIEGK